MLKLSVEQKKTTIKKRATRRMDNDDKASARGKSKKHQKIKEEETLSNSKSTKGIGIMNKKIPAQLIARIDKIEKYLQDRFNWQNVKKDS